MPPVAPISSPRRSLRTATASVATATRKPPLAKRRDATHAPKSHESRRGSRLVGLVGLRLGSSLEKRRRSCGAPRSRRLLAVTACVVAACVACPSSPAAQSSGTYTTEAALEVPFFRGIEPDLRLIYDSSRGNGWVGGGLRLQGLLRHPVVVSHGGAPRYDDSDAFYFDGVRLIPCGAPGTERSPSCTSECAEMPNGYGPYEPPGLYGFSSSTT
jgi:hypothetical protein